MVKGVPFSARLIAGGLILLALVYMVVPLFMVAASSVTESQFMSFPPKGFSLQWFSEVFRSEKYLESAWTSFKLVGMVVILSVTIGTMTALSLSRLRFRGGEALSGVFLSPLRIKVRFWIQNLKAQHCSGIIEYFRQPGFMNRIIILDYLGYGKIDIGDHS